MVLCPGRGRYQGGPGRLSEDSLLCFLSCDGSVTCFGRLLRPGAECLLEAAEALRSRHPLEHVGPFAVAIGNGRLYVLGWWFGLAWRMLRRLGRTDGWREANRDGARRLMYREGGDRAEATRLGVRSNSFACVGVRGWARDSGGKWVGIDD